MRISKFTKIIPLPNGSFLLANLFWKTKIEISNLDYSQWKEFLEHPSTFTFENEALRHRLLETKILRNDDADEIEIMRQAYSSNRFSSTVLGLTIAPTLDCNLACVYCYEDKRPGRMSIETENALIRFVESALPGKTRFKVIWYGGEPLLCKESIIRLSKVFLELAKQNGCDYSAEMVTNGLLLDRNTVEQLEDLGHWTNFQITIDGGEYHHNKKRPRRGGSSSYKKIYSNVLFAHRILPITLSMNIDRQNSASCHELLEDLSSALRTSEISVRFSPIHPYGEGCRDIGEKSDVSTVNNIEFAEIESDLLAHAQQLGFRTLDLKSKPIASSCQATSTHSFVVEPDGTLQRCWTEVGNRKTKIGTIWEPIVLNESSSMRWLQFDPTRIEPCKSCDVLPICFGGCPQRHIDQRPIEMLCKSIRYNVERRLIDEHIGQNRNEQKTRIGSVKRYPVFFLHPVQGDGK